MRFLKMKYLWHLTTIFKYSFQHFIQYSFQSLSPLSMGLPRISAYRTYVLAYFDTILSLKVYIMFVHHGCGEQNLEGRTNLFPFIEIQYLWYLNVVFVHEHLHQCPSSLFQFAPHFPKFRMFFTIVYLLWGRILEKIIPGWALTCHLLASASQAMGVMGLCQHTQIQCSVLLLKHYQDQNAPGYLG